MTEKFDVCDQMIRCLLALAGSTLIAAQRSTSSTPIMARPFLVRRRPIDSQKAVVVASQI